MIQFVTDRTWADVQQQNQKGTYNYSDLNRVEEAVQYLSFILRSFTQIEELETKSDWNAPGNFSQDSWPVLWQMDRYLGNVKKLCDSSGVIVSLPFSMENLTWASANEIEKALYQVFNYAQKNYKEYIYSGSVFAGEEFGL